MWEKKGERYENRFVEMILNCIRKTNVKANILCDLFRVRYFVNFVSL